MFEDHLNAENNLMVMKCTILSHTLPSFQGRDKHADDTGAAPEELPVLPPFLAAALRGRNVSRNNPALAKNHNQALKNKG